MAFSNRIGNALKQALSKRIIPDLSLSNSSMYQAFRSMSSSKLFVGGLSYGTDETSLKEAFNQYGDLVDVRIIMDRETGRSRGFGFVSFTSTESATAAMQNLDGQDLHGRRIKVNYATEKPRGGFGGGGDGYSGGGGNYNSGYSGGGGNYISGYSSGGGNYNSGYSSGGGNYNSGYPSGGNYNSGYTGADNNSGYSSGGNYNSGGGGGYNSNYAATQETNFNDKNENFTASSGNFNSGFADDGNYSTNTGLEEAGGYNVGQQQMNIKQEGAEFVKDDLQHSSSLDDGNYRDDDDDADGFANRRGINLLRMSRNIA